MIVTDRNLTGGPILGFLTELNSYSVNNRRRLKGSFMENDNTQLENYINDLEATIVLNKGVINDLAEAKKGNGLNTKILEKINKENKILHGKVKALIKERRDMQAKILMSEQIIEEFKNKENDAMQQSVEKQNELLDQLNRKEYVIQLYEYKLHQAISLLKKHHSNDLEVNLLYKGLTKENREEKCLSNIVEENEILMKNLKTIHEMIIQLEQKFNNIIVMHECASTLDDFEIPELDNNFLKKKFNLKHEIKAIYAVISKLFLDEKMISNIINSVKIEKDDLSGFNSKQKQEVNSVRVQLKRDSSKINTNHLIKKKESFQIKNSVKSDISKSFGDISSIIEGCKEIECSGFGNDLINND